jgi:hypothetical protein
LALTRIAVVVADEVNLDVPALAPDSPEPRPRLRRSADPAGLKVVEAAAMRARFDLRVLLGAVLLSALLGAANNLSGAHAIAWVGSPERLQDPFDLERLPHLTGALKGVQYAWKELSRRAAPVARASFALAAGSYRWWRLARIRWAEIAETWFRLGMAAIFLAACAYKLKDPSEFAMAVAQYQLLPAPLVNGFSLFVPALELVVALGLVFTRSTRDFYLLLTLLWAMFIAALAQALYRRLGITCGCFAIQGVDASVGETWFSLLRDVVLIVPSAWLALRADNRFAWRRGTSV